MLRNQTNHHPSSSAPPERQVPHSEEAEQGALGCILQEGSNPTKVGQMILELSDSDFYNLQHKSIFNVLVELHHQGIKLDPITVHQRLKDKNLLEAVGGLGYVASLLDAIPSAANFEYYRNFLKDKARRRNVLKLAELATKLAYNEDNSETLAQDFVRQAEFHLNGVGKQGLPEIDRADSLLQADVPLPPEIIEGVLHQGSKGVLGSGSKARKTWTLLDLAISVAAGVNWWKWPTRKGKVLYINFEIARAFIGKRIQAVMKHKGVTDTSNLDVWTLRGHGAPLGKLVADIIRRGKEQGYVLIIIDPIYKGLGGRDENSAGDISQLCNELERIAVETGAAVVFAAHFSKGNQAGKESIDRISGSGVFARDPDTIITLTKHKEDDAYTVEMVLRNFPEQPPFVVRWDYPLMVERPDLNPAELKQLAGRPKEFDDEAVLGLLPPEGLKTTEWLKLAEEELGISRSSFHRSRDRLERSGRILKSKLNTKWQPKSK